MGNSDFQFPPGFRFRPLDEELIVHYLENKVNSRPLPASVIAEIDLYKYNPWELPNKALFGEDEWYFFTPRERKYPKGARLNRAAASGYWKATGTDKPIVNSCGSRRIGVKKALVFYTGPPPKRVKTKWIMNEYRLLHPSTSSRFKGSMRLDDWVLCRVRRKGNVSKNTYEDGDSCSMELPSYSPKMVEEVQHTSTDYNVDMIMDNPFKDCQILPLILKGALPPFETISSLSFGGSQKGNDHLTSVYGDASNNLKSSTTVSSLDSYFRKFSEENEYESFLSNEKEIKDLQPSKTLANYDMNCYSQNHSQYDNVNPKPSEPISVFQELIELPFTEKYLQS